jgi:hypothetical protein
MKRSDSQESWNVLTGNISKIKAPHEYSQSYVNRKGYHSVILQAVCSHDMRFTSCFNTTCNYNIINCLDILSLDKVKPPKASFQQRKHTLYDSTCTYNAFDLLLGCLYLCMVSLTTKLSVHMIWGSLAVLLVGLEVFRCWGTLSFGLMVQRFVVSIIFLEMELILFKNTNKR